MDTVKSPPERLVPDQGLKIKVVPIARSGHRRLAAAFPCN